VDERVVQFRVGVMVLFTLLITVILVVLFGSGGRTILKSHYAINITFPDAPGVGTGTPIKKSGVLIGRVGNVELLDRGVRVVADIDKDRKLRHNETLSVNTTLLGDATLEVVPVRGKEADTVDVKPGETIAGEVRGNPAKVITNLEGGLAEAVNSVSQTSDNLRTVVNQFGKLLTVNEQKINNIISQTDQTTKSLSETLGKGGGVFGDPQTKQDLKRAISQAPELFETTRKTLEQMNQTMILLNQNLDNMSRFTGSLGDKGSAAIAKLDDTATKLDKLMAELVRLTESVNSGQGTLGQLVNNPDLYQNLNRAVTNVEELSRQLRPILNDVRVFSDKIARHPESRGVRGAITPDLGTKW
jgi:phospholipid/cholesterol/gamma-HCH transport system substrate-binding protein